MRELKSSIEIAIRFSEVDSMNIVWHGSYPLYFEDAREAFGRDYGLEYLTIRHHGYYAPLVELTFHYKRPLRYGNRARVDIVYRPCLAAKLVFDYAIYDCDDGALVATGHSVQVFIDTSYALVWDNPAFFQAWKERWQQLEEGHGI